MDITDWFDIENKEHMEAYDHLRQTGEWPKGFIPRDITFIPEWTIILIHKLANAYIDRKLWQPIETAPDDDTQIDIWSIAKGRLTDYHLVIRSEDNIFYEPGKHGGYVCIRDAIYWMPIPKDPVIKKEVKNKK